MQFRALLYQLEDLNCEAQRLTFCFIVPCRGLIPSIGSPGVRYFIRWSLFLREEAIVHICTYSIRMYFMNPHTNTDTNTKNGGFDSVIN